MESSSAASTTELCICTQLDNGIYSLTINGSSQAAVDEFVSHLDQIYLERKGIPTLYFLLDMSQVRLPITYTMHRARELLALHPNRPGTYTAFIVRSNVIALLDGLIKLVRTQNKDQVRFFKPTDRERAIAWLCDNSLKR